MLLEMNRRAWMEQVLCSAGAAALVPVLARGQGSEAAWKSQFFTAEQNDCLSSLGECMVPGSTAALSNRVIDLIMTVESEKNKNDLVQALAAFDAEAKRRYQKVFHELARQQQEELLTAACMSGAPLQKQFELVKEWVADAYWSSEQGLRELGWTGQVAWEKFDACEHEGKHPDHAHAMVRATG
jgi:hypothetical protein